VEDIVRQVVTAADLAVVVSNIGVTPGLSSIYTSNSGQHTAFVQVSLRENHRIGSYDYMARVRRRLQAEVPQLSAYFQSGGLVDAVLNLGLPAPVDLQVSGANLEQIHHLASTLARKISAVPGVSDVLIPQDMDYPAIKLDVDRERTSQLGMTSKEVIGNVITALTSDLMIEPSYWVDPVTGNDYFLTVQYPENQVNTLEDLKAIPLRSPHYARTTRLDSVVTLRHVRSPTEVDHYQLRRVVDVFVAPEGEDLGNIAKAIDKIVSATPAPKGTAVTLRGMVESMRESFRSFGLGLLLSIVLVYLILVAQFKSWLDPFLILLAVPPGLIGVLLVFLLTDTTLNVMSLMGIVIMVGIVVSNSILLVEFTHRLQTEGKPLDEVLVLACRIRLRPILMTSLATVFGLLPMALKLGTGSEAYAPLARVIIGGLTCSVMLTMFLVPAAYFLANRRKGDIAAKTMATA
jgi:multidrug efflux pump subunit AcrB